MSYFTYFSLSLYYLKRYTKVRYSAVQQNASLGMSYVVLSEKQRYFMQEVVLQLIFFITLVE